MPDETPRHDLARITALTRAWLRGDAAPVFADAMPAADAPATVATMPSDDSPADRVARLAAAAAAAATCQACPLGQTRTRSVFGQGNPVAELFLVGEAPGEEEDRQGIAFCGPSGELLEKMLAAIGLNRDAVHIANLLKCRPPHNRKPAPDELGRCFHFLEAQLDIVRPRLICTLGAAATQALLGTQAGISRLRGTVHDYHGIPLVPTFHPAYLLREPGHKREAWADLQLVRKLLDEPAGR